MTRSPGIVLVALLLAPPNVRAEEPQTPSADAEWRYPGGDAGWSRYSPLDQIDRTNFRRLRVAWRRSGADASLTARLPANQSVSGYLSGTPVLVDGVLFAPNALGLVEAFDPGTGRTLWIQQPFAPEEIRAASTRGVAFWGSGAERRLLSVRGEYLYALDPRTGEPLRAFGEQGRVHLRSPEPGARNFSWGCGPTVVGDVAVVGGIRGGAGDRAETRERERADVRGYDARSGRLLWTFHVIPQAGEFGVETWEGESWRFSGDSGAWSCLSADEELGYVYLPLSAPSTAFYGGHRLGDNLFSNSLVALDARTGERVWHFQMTHHGAAEYENVGAPILGDLTVAGRRVRAVIQINKTGFLFAFDRVTGEPLWPIEERPVPASTVPGERMAPTQPFPTKPPPIEPQGVTPESLIDITPELEAEAREFLARHVYGPLYTPMSIMSEEPGGTLGTLSVPHSWGGTNWNTGALDLETGVFFGATHTLAGVDALVRATSPDQTVAYVRVGSSPVFMPESGLPPIKPPWGRVSAVDMNAGELLWMVPNGEGPQDHPALRDAKGLDPLGFASRPVPLVTRTLLVLGEGSDVFGGTADYMWGTRLRAYDKATGDWLDDLELGNGTTGGPMTYMHEGRQYIVVPTGSRGRAPEWIALALP